MSIELMESRSVGTSDAADNPMDADHVVLRVQGQEPHGLVWSLPSGLSAALIVSAFEPDDTCTAAVVLPDGAVVGLVLLSSGDAGEQLPTVHEERGLLSLAPLKIQLTAAGLDDLLIKMAAAHAAAQGE